MGRSFVRSRGLRASVPPVAALALASAGVIAGGGPAAAGPHTGGLAGHQGGRVATAGIISTVAGGVGGPAQATKVAISSPFGVAFSGGNVYVGDGGSVRAVSLQTGRLTTPAGTGAANGSGDGGPAVQAILDLAGPVATGPSGGLLIDEADPDNGRIRMVAPRTGTFYGLAMTAGDIYTVAGGGHGGLGDGGPATSASLALPEGVAVDGAGNLVIADLFDSRVRVVAASTGTFYGQAMTAGDIYTVAGGGAALGDGVPATSASIGPGAVAVDGAGNLVIETRTIRVVAASTGTFYGQAMTAGDIYTVAGNGTLGFSGDGGPATSASIAPDAVTVDSAGNLVIADAFFNVSTGQSSQRIRVVAAVTGTFYGKAMTAGDIYTVAGRSKAGFSGDGGPATRANLAGPRGVAVDSAGNLVVADSGNNRVRVVAAGTGTFYGQAMTAGDIYTIAGNGTGHYSNDLGTGGFSGDGGPATHAELDPSTARNGPQGVATDGAGNLVIADTDNNRVRVVAASTGSFYGQAMTAGDIYTVAGGGTGGLGDRGPATSAELNGPLGVAVGHAGNLLIADLGNGRIRVVAARTGTFYGQAMTAGDIYTVAGGGTGGLGDRGPATSAEVAPDSVAVDATGNLLIATGDRIRVVAARTGTFYGKAMTGGDIYTVAGNDTHRQALGDGGPASRAKLAATSVVADGAGNLVIGDAGHNRVRVVAARTGTFYGKAMTADDIYTVAGTGSPGFSGDGGPAASAALNDPIDVALDASGNLLIADNINCRVRVVAQKNGTFYGRAMTIGDIYTVAGSTPTNGVDGCLGGNEGFFGDGGPAVAAGLSFPAGVTADDAGNLVIADTSNERIRRVTG